MKRKGNRFARLGVLSIALLLSLCLVGVGYAAWSDTVVIEQGVTTGTWYEGCSLGFWRTQPGEWEATGYSPGVSFNSTFERDAFDPDITLMDALWLQGGWLNALARQAVAALLNAAHPDVNYALTVEEVIEKVQYAIDSGYHEAIKDELEDYNTRGCPFG